MSKFNFLRNGLIALALALAIPMLSWSQSATTAPPQITIFLADPQLGVVGVDQSGGNTLYFEARTPAGSTQMSARLLDADGRTIAISGVSMDSQWLSNTAYDAPSAAQSLSLATAFANQLYSALPGGSAFSRESAALSNLAVAAAQAPIGTSALRIDSITLTGNLPALTVDTSTAIQQYEALDAQNLAYTRDSLGNLNVTFRGAALHAFVLNFPDAINEDTGNPGVVEISSQLVTADGTSIAQQLGGDYIPDEWYAGMFPATPPTAVDPIQLAMGFGNAIRGALLLGRYPSIATADEAAAIRNIALHLRGFLFPDPIDASTGGCQPGAYYSRVGIWKKSLVIIAEHSGTVVRHALCNSRRSLNWYGHSVYCNHGTCPGVSPMSLEGPPYTTGPLGTPRYAPHAKVPNGQTGAGTMHSCYKTVYDLWSGQGCWTYVFRLGYRQVCSPGHNCHDDSWTQLRAIKGESFDLLAPNFNEAFPSTTPINAPRCNDNNLYISAPKYTD